MGLPPTSVDWWPMWSTWLVLSLLAPAHAAGMDRGSIGASAEPEAAGVERGAPSVGRLRNLSAFDEDPATLLLGFMPVVHLGVDLERLAEVRSGLFPFAELPQGPAPAEQSPDLLLVGELVTVLSENGV